ncbi:MAG: hypothetical protein VST67_12360 [Nitrospirota bacterium]|nr:hypothetical protein [Nitrospirota bacterium]
MLSAKKVAEEKIELEIYEDEPEGLIGRLQTYWRENLNDIILLIIMTCLTVINFSIEAKLVSLNFFYLVIFVTGYTMNKRFAILAAFFTILMVWAFILADKSQYLSYLTADELNRHMMIWSCVLILTGWAGGFLAKLLGKNTGEESQS